MIVQPRNKQNGVGELIHSTNSFAAVRGSLGAMTGTLVAGIFAILLAPAGSAQAKDLGTWLTADRKAKIELRECGETGLCSAIVWLKDPLDENGKPWRDIINQDSVKRGRPIIGIDVLEGLKKIGPQTWTGNIYDPEEGKPYYLKHIKVQPDRVEIRGCLSTGWPCRTKYWTRSTPVRPPAPPVQIAKQRPVPQLPPPRTATIAPPRTAAVTPRASAPATRPGVSPPQQLQPAQRRAAVKQPARPPAPAARRAAASAAPARRAPVTTTGSLPRPSNVAPPHPNAGYLVQITAGQNQNEALTAFGKLQRRFPNLLGGYLPNIQKVNLGPKGTWYRVRVGPMGQRTAAVGFCNQLKSAGADCLIRRD